MLGEKYLLCSEWHGWNITTTVWIFSYTYIWIQKTVKQAALSLFMCHTNFCLKNQLNITLLNGEKNWIGSEWTFHFCSFVWVIFLIYISNIFYAFLVCFYISNMSVSTFGLHNATLHNEEFLWLFLDLLVDLWSYSYSWLEDVGSNWKKIRWVIQVVELKLGCDARSFRNLIRDAAAPHYKEELRWIENQD